MKYRWLTEQEITDIVNPDLEYQGQAQLNTATARVLGAFDGDVLCKSLVVQLFPVLGPMSSHDHAHRDDGAVSRELAKQMDAFLREQDARGWMAICESPVTERLCERYGMKKVTVPVYIAVPTAVH